MPTRPHFLYDADCGPCTRLKSVASFLDAAHRVDFLPIDQAARQGLMSTLPKQDWFSSSHMVRPDGTTTSAGDSMLDLLSLLPGGKLPAAIVSRAPFGPASARFVYGAVSRLHSSTCSTAKRSAWSPL